MTHFEILTQYKQSQSMLINEGLLQMIALAN